MNLKLDIAAWHFDLDEDPGPDCLDRTEIERAKTISNPLMRRRYQGTRSRVRQVLAARLKIAPEEIRIEIAASGKPQLTPPAALHFSISHSQNVLVIALCDAPIGVDIEVPRTRENALALAARFFSAPDFETLEDAYPAALNAAFLRQWVAKEAALKTAGLGLTDVLREARCDFIGERIHAVSWPGQRASIEPFDLPGGAIGALAWFGDQKASVHWHVAAEIEN